MKYFALLSLLLLSAFGYAQIAFPIDFESTSITYTFTDFGGGQMSRENNPDKSGINTSNRVARMIKNAGEPFAGSLLQLSAPINFSTNKHFKMKVWTPGRGRKVLLKVENLTNGNIFFEQERLTTVGNAWEELVFDFSAINTANSYQKLVFIFDLGTVGNGTPNFTFYVDDIEQFRGGGGNVKAQVDLPITFQDTATVNYALTDFGGNASSIVRDPTDASNLVGRAIKTAAAESWAGTTNGGSGLAKPIPFTAANTKMSVRVWSPDANIPIRLKVENAASPTISVETEARTTRASTWETLEFNFSNQATGTAALNLANTYNKVSIFFNFGATGAAAGEKTYYWDDVRFIGGGGNVKAQVDLPITFQDTATVNYALTDFGGNVSAIVRDPTNQANIVGRAIKTAAAEPWAGTTNGGGGLAKPIPFTATSTRMTVRVWSPDANTPIRLKVENAANPNISVETEARTTRAATWETLEFNFSNQATGTAALNLANTYNKVSIFFNFGTTGAMAGEKTYYWDDVRFGSLVNVKNLEAAAGGIRIYPNPATDFCRIAFSEVLNSPARLSVFDANGTLVKTVIIAQENAVLALEDLNNGMYYLRLEKDAKAYFQKLVVVR